MRTSKLVPPLQTTMEMVPQAPVTAAMGPQTSVRAQDPWMASTALRNHWTSRGPPTPPPHPCCNFLTSSGRPGAAVDPGYFPLAPSCCVWKSKKQVGRGRTAGSDGPPQKEAGPCCRQRHWVLWQNGQDPTHVQDAPWGPYPGSPNHDLKLRGKPPL